MPNVNISLNIGKAEKNGEFYTLMEDIEDELSKYDFCQFKDKVIYCNCDDPTWSNFFKFFVKWGNKIGIKKVHFTNYANGKRQFKQLTLFDFEDLKESAEDDKKGTAHYWIFTPKINKIVKKELKGNGDFRSEECLNILRQSDIIITNPPFSLFREFIELVVNKYNKKILTIGDINARTYKEIFPLIKDNRLWCGYTQPKKFLISENEFVTFGNKCWYTNLQTNVRTTPLVLHVQDITQFSKYDNYDAIEIPQIKLIPDNYYGTMGVPVTFLDKYCPNQFEVLGNEYDLAIEKGRGYINGKRMYSRIFIKRKGEKNEISNRNTND